MSLDQFNPTIVKNVGWQYSQFTIVNTPAIVQADYSLTVGIVWTWVADSGTSASVAGCAGNRSCITQNPTVSGTMTADAIVNGVAKQVSKRVNVLACVTGDSLLDDARVRKQLKLAWDASAADGPQSGRIEIFGGSFAGPPRVDTTWVGGLPGANACRAYVPGSGPGQWNPPEGTLGPLQFWWHTHPWYPDDTSRESASICPQYGEPKPGYGLMGGPSPEGDLTSHTPLITIDKTFTYVSHQSPSGRWNTVKKARATCDPAA